MVPWFSISKALIVRCALIFHVLLCTWRVTINLDNNLYWLLVCILIPLICESFYTIIRRQGREFSRFTPCFFFYLGAVLPGIWLLELDRTERYIQDGGVQPTSSSDPTDVIIAGNSESVWLIVIEEMLPYVIFISRWIVPRGKITREELAELLFAFIEIGADIMEFFSLFDENVIRENKTMAYCVLTIWSVSLLQFTMIITFINHPRSENAVRHKKVKQEKDEEWRKAQHEIFAIFVTMLMQDLPFAVMRLYTIIEFNRITYSLIFFTSKNLLIIVLLLYKLAILCKMRYFPDPEEDSHAADAKDGIEEISEAERGNLRRNVSLAGSLARLSTSSKKSATSFDDSYTQRNHSTTEEESGLKKRHGKHDKSYLELNDNGTLIFGSNGKIIDANGRQLPKPHRSAESIHIQTGPLPDTYIDIASEASSMSSSYNSSEEPAKGIIKSFGDSPKEPQKSMKESDLHSSAADSMPSRPTKKLSLEDESSTNSFDSQNSKASLLSSLKNQEGSSFPPAPELTSKETPNKISKTTPEPTLGTTTSPSHSKSHVAQDSGSNQTKPAVKVQGPHVSVIKL